MKAIYCSKCGMKLAIDRKALPKYGQIITTVDPHVCSETFIEPDLVPQNIVPYVDKKFVQIPNDLREKLPFEEEPGDKRSPEHIKSTAPSILLERLKGHE